MFHLLNDPTAKAAIISGLVSFVFGGGFMAWLKFRRDGRAEDRTFAESEREKMRAEIDRLQQAVSAMSARLIPSNLPTWVKDDKKRYIDVNPAWEIQIGTRIGKFKHDVIGKTDLEVFDGFPDFAETIGAMDMEAANSGGVAVKTGIVFPRNSGKRIVIKEIIVNDIMGNPVFKGIAVPELS